MSKDRHNTWIFRWLPWVAGVVHLCATAILVAAVIPLCNGPALLPSWLQSHFANPSLLPAIVILLCLSPLVWAIWMQQILRLVWKSSAASDRALLIFEALDDSLIVHRFGGEILLCNDAAVRLFGFSRDELRGMSIASLQDKNLTIRYLDLLRKHLEEGTESFEASFITKGGRRVACRVKTVASFYRNKPAIMSIIEEHSDKSDSEASRLKYRLDFEEKMMSFSSRLIGSLLPDLDQVAMEVQASLADFLDADRSIIVFFDAEVADLYSVLEWKRDSVAPSRFWVHAPKSKERPWISGQVRTVRQVLVNSLDELPPEAEEDRDLLARDGVEAFLIVPMSVGGAPNGFMMVQSVRKRSGWPDDALELAALSAELLSGAFLRRYTDNQISFNAQLVAQAREAVIAVDVLHHVSYINPGAERLLGCSIEEVLYQPFLDLFADEQERETFRATVLNAEKDEGRFNAESSMRLRKKDGTVFHAHLSVSSWKTPDEKPYGLIIYVTDITEQKLAGDALRLSEERYALAVQATDDVIWDWDLQEKMLYRSRQCREVLGLPESEPRDPLSKWWGRVHPDDMEMVRQAYLSSWQERKPLRIEYRHLDNTENYRWLLTRGETIFSEAGEPIRMVGSTSDITESKQVEIELRESRKSLAALMANLPGMAYRCQNDEEWTMDFVSEGSYILTGYSPSDLVNSQEIAYNQLIHPDNRDEVRRMVNLALSLRQPFRIFYRIRCSSGEEKWVWEQGRGIFNEHGDLLRIEGFVANITDRVLAEQALRDSELKYRELVENAHNVILNLDSEGRILFANHFAQDFLHYSHQDLIGLPIAEIIPSFAETVDGNDGGSLLHAFSNPAKIVEKEIATYAKGGREAWVSWIFKGIHDKDDHLTGLLLVGTDVTERRRAEQQLRLQQRETQAFLDALPAMAFLKDRDGVYRMANRAFMEAVGDNAQTIIGKTDADFFPPEKANLYRETDREVLKTGHSLEFEERDFPINGENCAILTRKVPVLDDMDNVIGVIGLGYDITERVEMEERMQQSQKLESLGILAGGVAHDFNNLLVGILGNAELAMMDLPESSPTQENLKEIERAAQRAADLASQMLAYSGKGAMVRRKVSLNDVITEMSDLLTVSVGKTARVEFDFLDALPLVEVDVDQIRQVVMNLVSNASEAMGNRAGKITLSTGKEVLERETLSETFVDDDLPSGAYAFLEVTDTGCGMDSATQARMFDPFFSTKFTGRGLGMAAVLGIVRGHNGAIQVESEPERGTSVRVFLPSAGEPLAVIRKGIDPDSLAHGEPKGLVLVVDDEETVRKVACRMLERIGYEAIDAADGPTALAIFRERHEAISIVLLDMSMPQMDGRKVLEGIRTIDPSAQVLLSSGYTEELACPSYDEIALAGYIQKPYTPKMLKEKLEAILK